MKEIQIKSDIWGTQENLMNFFLFPENKRKMSKKNVEEYFQLLNFLELD
jgi:hypothetical protein